MKNKYSKIIALFLALSCLFSGTALSVNISADSNAELVTDTLTPAEYAMVYNEANYENEFEPGIVIVGLKNRTPTSNYENIFSELDIVSIEEISNSTLAITLKEQTCQSVLDAIELLKNHPDIRVAEPNYYYQIASEVIPNDPIYNSEDDAQWNMKHVEANYAWNYTTGNSNIKVGVIDTGIYPSPDLLNNLDMDSGINYINPLEDPIDDNGHGTHVAGIIGAVGNNGIGVAGISWNVTLIPFKVADYTGQASSLAIQTAIEDASTLGLDIINISMYHTAYSDTMATAIANFDGLVVVCAGNAYPNLSPFNLDQFSIYPACYAETCDNIISVGNSTNSDTPYTTSNYGNNTVHLFAPGVSIKSTFSTSYLTNTGTSQAAPHITGAVALIMAEYPNATIAQIKDAIIYSVNKSDALTNYCIADGILNIRRAIEYLSDLHGNGDVNMDGSINNIDLITLARYIEFAASEDFSYASTDSRALNEDQVMRADMNKDNVITEADTQALGQYLVQRSLNLEVQ